MAAWPRSGKDDALRGTLGSPIPVDSGTEAGAGHATRSASDPPPSYLRGVGVLVAAFVVCVGGLAMASGRSGPPSDALTDIEVPGYASGELGPGSYEVVVANQQDEDPWFEFEPTLEPPEITVWIAADPVRVTGSQVPWSNEEPIASFEVEAEGVYDVVADVPAGVSMADLPSSVSVRRSADAVRTEVLLWLLVAFVLGGVLALAGTVVLVRTASRRRQLRPPRPAYATPAGYWAGYPVTPGSSGPYGQPVPGPYGQPVPGPYGQPVPGPYGQPVPGPHGGADPRPQPRPGAGAGQEPDEGGFAPPS